MVWSTVVKSLHRQSPVENRLHNDKKQAEEATLLEPGKTNSGQWGFATWADASREDEGEGQSGTVCVYNLLPIISTATECRKLVTLEEPHRNLLKLFQHLLAHSGWSQRLQLWNGSNWIHIFMPFLSSKLLPLCATACLGISTTNGSSNVILLVWLPTPPHSAFSILCHCVLPSSKLQRGQKEPNNCQQRV